VRDGQRRPFVAGQIAVAPGRQCHEHREEVEALLRQTILIAFGVCLIGSPFEHAVLDHQPLAVAPTLDSRVAAGGEGGVVFAGPFETVTPWQWDWFDRE